MIDNYLKQLNQAPSNETLSSTQEMIPKSKNLIQIENTHEQELIESSSEVAVSTSSKTVCEGIRSREESSRETSDHDAEILAPQVQSSTNMFKFTYFKTQ